MTTQIHSIGSNIEYAELTAPAGRIARVFMLTASLIFLATAVFLILT